MLCLTRPELAAPHTASALLMSRSWLADNLVVPALPTRILGDKFQGKLMLQRVLDSLCGYRKELHATACHFSGASVSIGSAPYKIQSNPDFAITSAAATAVHPQVRHWLRVVSKIMAVRLPACQLIRLHIQLATNVPKQFRAIRTRPESHIIYLH